jgi:transcriptional regulator with XRE-family HTH domain
MQAPIPQLAYHWPMPGGRPQIKTAPKFGQRMAAFRIAKGLSQFQLADALGMTRDQIAYYERAAKNPSMEVVGKVAAFFGVSVGELFNDTAKTAKKPGPPSQFAKFAERLDQLPRSHQKAVATMLEGYLKQVAS